MLLMCIADARSCKHCAYKAVSKARMKLHICIHMHGIRCDRCKKSFPNQITLRAHLKRHAQSRPTFDCDLCENFTFAFICMESAVIDVRSPFQTRLPCVHISKDMLRVGLPLIVTCVKRLMPMPLPYAFIIVENTGQVTHISSVKRVLIPQHNSFSTRKPVGESCICLVVINRPGMPL